MKSGASIKSHPLHPMLIPFPLAFLSGAFAFDVAGMLFERNQISIDHRYAGAGRWREERHDTAGDVLVLKKPDDLKRDQLMLVHARDRRFVIGRTEHGFVAFDDHCTHRGGSLADGVMICGTVQCPWHGSQFDGDGAVRAGPAQEKIGTYRVEEGETELRVYLLQ